MTVRIPLFVAALTLAACSGDVDYAAPGVHGVGFTVLEADDLTVKAWYPTDDTGEASIDYSAQVRLFGPDSPEMPFFGAAHADAEPAEGRHPLVVLSHGFGMSPEWYHPLAEHLASRGFVVLGPEHVEYDWATDVLAVTVSRPTEVSATIDFAAAGALDGTIDTERIAVVGHSYGGTTALSVGGARIHTGWLTETCAGEVGPFEDAFFCQPFLGQQDVLAAAAGLDDVPGGLWPSFADDRVDAVLAMAPDAGMFGDIGLAELAVPTMVLGGTGDTAAPWSWGGGLVFEHASSPTLTRATFEGAEHFIVTTTCDRMPWTAELPEDYRSMFCSDPAWDKPTALELTNGLATAFLADVLLDERRAGKWLENHEPVVGLEVESID